MYSLDFLRLPPLSGVPPPKTPMIWKFNWQLGNWQGLLLGFSTELHNNFCCDDKNLLGKNKFSQGTSWIWMGRSRLLQILASIHLKSPHRGKRQISIWIKSARVWYIYSLRRIISSCKPNITNCLETSKECQSIFQENLYSCFGESFSIQCNQN